MPGPPEKYWIVLQKPIASVDFLFHRTITSIFDVPDNLSPQQPTLSINIFVGKDNTTPPFFMVRGGGAS